MSVNSGMALDVEGISTTPGARIHQWSYVNGKNQMWQFVANGDGSFQVVSANSGLCLDVIGVSTAPGALLQQWTCWGGTNQHWKLVDVGNGASELVNVNSGLALDVIGVSKTIGAYLQQWSYWGGTNQQWRVQAVDASGNPTSGAGPASSGGSGGSSTPATTPPASGSTSHASVGCGRGQGQVTVGGVAGVQSLVDASTTAKFRSCGGGLYIHQVGWGTPERPRQTTSCGQFCRHGAGALGNG